MAFKFSKKGIERIILNSVLKRPYLMFMDSKIYYTPSKIEEVVLSRIEGNVTAQTLIEFEDAIQDPNVESIYVTRYAAITSTSLKTVLERNGLAKTIYCAFNVQA